MLIWIAQILKPYLEPVQWWVEGNPALLIMDAGIPSSLTWRFQRIDVVLVALWKTKLYDLRSQQMLEQIEFANFREASWNYVLEQIMLAWDGPESKVTEKVLLKGIKLCCM